MLDFDEEEMATFIRRWTVVVERQAHQGGQVSRYEAERESSELLEAIQKNSAIRKLASNPLLLTMLVIQKRQGISLPHHRVILYEQYIVSLLRDWLLARSLHDSPRHLPNDRILRKVLEPLAWWLQESEPGKGLVNEEDLLVWLRNYYSGKDDPDQAARTFISDVREHSGLLIDRGGRRFGFMHLTFMEYLAGVSLANRYQHGLREMVDRISAHAGEAEWRETILLSIGYLGLNQKFDQATTDLLTQLLDKPANDAGIHHEIVAAALADMGEEGVTPEGWFQLRQRLIKQGLGQANIPAPTRVSIGRFMAEMGDPRKEVLEVDAMVFCAVLAGPFFLGSTAADDMAFDNETRGSGVYGLDYSFAISNYPVTVTQFRQFTEEARFQPENPDCLRGSDNAPVVYVSWDEAIAFCDWLTTKWRKKDWLPIGWRVDLPSEPEWEKAARGGEAIPVSPQLAAISPGMIPTLSSRLEMVANNLPRRHYPWGSEVDAERMNFAVNIGEVSTVGCYPGGASPYGCEDMSGNVWEWTRSLYENYPYPDQPEGRKTRASREERGSRVLRGGSFFDGQTHVRCSVRNYYDPYYRDYVLGFRVVLSPLL